MKDKLFLMRPDFFKDSEGPFYCADSASVEGLLSFYPKLRDEVEVEYIDAPRPRAPIVRLLGEDNQSVPVLVLGAGRMLSDPESEIRSYGAQRFIDAPEQIRRYLSSQYGVAHSS